MAKKKTRRKTKRKTNRVYRRNPDESQYPSLPHEEEDLSQAAIVFSRDYDRVRATMSLEDGLLTSGEVIKRAGEKARSKTQIDKRKQDIANFLETVDFQPYYDSLFHFQYDIEGFLEALRSQFGEKGSKGSRDLHKQYSLVLRKCQALITALKQLHRPKDQEGNDLWANADFDVDYDDEDEDED